MQERLNQSYLRQETKKANYLNQFLRNESNNSFNVDPANQYQLPSSGKGQLTQTQGTSFQQALPLTNNSSLALPGVATQNNSNGFNMFQPTGNATSS